MVKAQNEANIIAAEAATSYFATVGISDQINACNKLKLHSHYYHNRSATGLATKE
jgi:hypothetical protein